MGRREIRRIALARNSCMLRANQTTAPSIAGASLVEASVAAKRYRTIWEGSDKGDIEDVRVLWLTFALFLVVGALASVVALLLFPDWRLACLMAAAVWAFCRAYYFAFYVIERYADPEYRFAGLGSFVRCALRRRTGQPREDG